MLACRSLLVTCVENIIKNEQFILVGALLIVSFLKCLHGGISLLYTPLYN